MSTAFMTSPIGDLTIDSDGLRTAIDEIARLRKIIENEMKNRTLLRIRYKNSDAVEEIAIKTANVIKTNVSDILYYETFSDEAGYGTKVKMTDVEAWEIKGTEPLGAGALLRL